MATIPSLDHFLPLAYLAGLRGAAHEEAQVLLDGFATRSLSLSAYTLACKNGGPGIRPN